MHDSSQMKKKVIKIKAMWLLAYHYGHPSSTLRLSNIGLGRMRLKTEVPWRCSYGMNFPLGLMLLQYEFPLGIDIVQFSIFFSLGQAPFEVLCNVAFSMSKEKIYSPGFFNLKQFCIQEGINVPS